MKISVIPLYKRELNNAVFNPQSLYNVSYYLKKILEVCGHQVSTVDLLPICQADIILLFDLHWNYVWQILRQKKFSKTIYLPFEPPVVYSWHEPAFLKQLVTIFPQVITWQDDLVDQQNFFKLWIPYYYVAHKPSLVTFQEKKLVTQISGHKFSAHPKELYTKRRELIRFFEKTIPDQFKFYGTGWPKHSFKSYGGSVKDKLEVMSHYKFAICFENQNHIKGYVTEKILDCFQAGVVPIYLGADNITHFIPQETFIDYRQFNSNENLLEHLQNMTEQAYQSYLTAADTFLHSKSFEQFLPQAFAKTICDFINNHPFPNKTNIKFLTAGKFLLQIAVKKFMFHFTQKRLRIQYAFCSKK